jgi:hypothetical protein
MRLELYIRGHFMISAELIMPQGFSFESHCELRETYVNLMIKSLKNRYQKAIENSEWEIILVAESKINESIIQLN